MTMNITGWAGVVGANEEVGGQMSWKVGVSRAPFASRPSPFTSTILCTSSNFGILSMICILVLQVELHHSLEVYLPSPNPTSFTKFWFLL